MAPDQNGEHASDLQGDGALPRDSGKAKDKKPSTAFRPNSDDRTQPRQTGDAAPRQ